MTSFCLSANQASATSIQNLSHKNTDVEWLINNRGYGYGDGFFSTMGVYQGQMLWAGYHKQRLISHCDALSISMDCDWVLQQLQQHALNINEGILKLVVNRQPQTLRGYGFNKTDSMAEVFLKTTPMSMPSYHNLKIDQNLNPTPSIPISKIGTACCLDAQIAKLPKSIAGLKSLNCLDNVLAAQELESKKSLYPNLTEALVSDVDNTWVEGVMSNIFYRLSNAEPASSNSCWYTPPINYSGVNGVMRQVIIDQLKPSNSVAERALSHNDLPNLSHLFFCNAVRGIMPIDTLYLADGQAVKLDGNVHI